jgi:hypothetical protein
MTPCDIYSRLLNTKQRIISCPPRPMRHLAVGVSSKTALLLRPPQEVASHLCHPWAVVPTPAAPLVAPRCLVSYVVSMTILLHGAIVASNSIFLVLATTGKATSAKFPWQLFRDTLYHTLLMFLGT